MKSIFETNLRESPVEKFMREERERRRLFEDVLRPSTLHRELERATQSLKLANQVAPVFKDRLSVFDHFASTTSALEAAKNIHRASSVMETARKIAFSRPLSLTEPSVVGGAIAESIRESARILEVTRNKIEFASSLSSLTQFATSLQADLSIARRWAEETRLVDALTLRASADEEEDRFAASVAEDLVTIEAVLTDLSEVDSEERAVVLLVRLMDGLAGIFSRIGQNTVRELSEIGLVKIIELTMAACGFYAFLFPSTEMTADQKAAFAKIEEQLDHTQEQLAELQRERSQLDEAFVADLSRGAIVRTATIRTAPSREGKVQARLQVDTPVAIAEARGRWKKVVYRDELSDQLAQGWVWARSIEKL